VISSGVHFLLTVAVLVYAPDGGGAATRRGAAERTLAAALRAEGAEVVADAVAQAAAAQVRGWVDRDELGFFARAAAHVAEGRQALARVELARAESELATAEQLYAPELGRDGVAAEAATAALWRGVALFELGRRGEAERAWRRAVALEPATELTEAMVRPDAARAFTAALRPRTAPPHTATATLTVQVAAGAPPAFAVDGRAHEAGAVVSVSVGEHLLRAGSLARLVDVPAAGATVTLELPRDTTHEAIVALAARPSVEGVAAARAALGVDTVLVAAVSLDGGELTYAAQRLQAGCASAVVTDVRADELVRRLAAAACGEPTLGVLAAPAIAHPRPARPAAPLAVTRPPAGSRPRLHLPLWQRPWLWATVVSALAVGVVVGVSVWPRDPTYSATVGFNQFALKR
jgi:hypothetical protein